MELSHTVLTYRFHNFRPSDRLVLKQVVCTHGGEGVFLAALEVYLGKWARADFVTEYEIERIAVWVGAHLGRPLLEKIAAMADREQASARTENAKKTYATMLDAVSMELRALKSRLGEAGTELRT